MNSIFRSAAVAIVVFGAVSLLTHNSTGAPTVTTSTAPARHYYLTKVMLNGNQALTACTTGYHFASFAEVSDPALITYNKTLGRIAADDGSGPPSYTAGVGWIRSGFSSNSNPATGLTPTNCNLWTSANSADRGEVLLFDPNIGGSSTGVTGAPVALFLNYLKCDNSDGDNIGVWCVQN